MNTTSALVVEIENKRYELTSAEWLQLDCIETDSNVFHLLEDGISHIIAVIDFDMATRSCTLNVDGEIKKVKLIRDLDLLIEKMGLHTTQTKTLSVLQAPMPGLVTGIKVSAGQFVEKGEPLLILEAMKMENVITAPHQATIKEVKVSIGQAVDKGVSLIEFAPA
jgi:acetyl/propionyl-CoA carboxylase alpha subunit